MGIFALFPGNRGEGFFGFGVESGVKVASSMCFMCMIKEPGSSDHFKEIILFTVCLRL